MRTVSRHWSISTSRCFVDDRRLRIGEAGAVRLDQGLQFDVLRDERGFAFFDRRPGVGEFRIEAGGADAIGHALQGFENFPEKLQQRRFVASLAHVEQLPEFERMFLRYLLQPAVIIAVVEDLRHRITQAAWIAWLGQQAFGDFSPQFGEKSGGRQQSAFGKKMAQF